MFCLIWLRKAAISLFNKFGNLNVRPQTTKKRMKQLNRGYLLVGVADATVKVARGGAARVRFNAFHIAERRSDRARSGGSGINNLRSF